MIAILRRRRIGLCGLFLLSIRAFTADYEYLFNTTFSGASPAGTNGWIEVLFHDLGAGKVSLTISNSGLTGSEFISSLYLNLNTNLRPNKLTFTSTGGNDPAGASSIQTGYNQFKGGGDGLYDILFNFPTTSNARFGAGEYLVYEVSGIPGLRALDFNYLSAASGGSTPLLAVAHVQAIGSSDASGWVRPAAFQPIPVPETQPVPLILLGVVLWTMWQLKYKRS